MKVPSPRWRCHSAHRGIVVKSRPSPILSPPRLAPPPCCLRASEKPAEAAHDAAGSRLLRRRPPEPAEEGRRLSPRSVRLASARAALCGRAFRALTAAAGAAPPKLVTELALAFIGERLSPLNCLEVDHSLVNCLGETFNLFECVELSCVEENLSLLGNLKLIEINLQCYDWHLLWFNCEL